MLNRSCQRCRIRKLGCSGGERCEQCNSADSECVYTERKTRTVKRKRQTFEEEDSTDDPFISNRFDQREQNSTTFFVANTTPSSSSTSQTQNTISNSSFNGDTSYSRTSIASSILASESIESTSGVELGLEDLLREARSAIGFSLEGCQILLNIAFRWRILPTIHGCIQIETIIRYLEILFNKTEEELNSNHLIITIDQLTLSLLCLSATILFMPSYGLHADLINSAKALSPEIEDGDPSIRQRAIFSLAYRLFYKQMNKHQHSLESIQMIIIFTFHRMEEDQFTSDQLYDQALRNALKLGFHRVEGFSALDEIKVRLWWFLVTRNWLAGPETWSYSIHPNQFTTRLPLNLEFSDLEWKLVRDHQQSVRKGWTIASYSLALISLAKVVRKLVDIHNELNCSQRMELISKRNIFQSKIVEKFKSVTETFVWFYRMDKKYDKDVAIANGFKFTQIGRVFIERWMLHQQIFHCFIELHEIDSFVNQRIPSTCLTLANHVLESADSCSHHCTILSASHLPRKSLISAATVISFDVLDRGNLNHHEEEYKKVAIAIEKAKILTGDKKSKDLQQLETLFNHWSKSMMNSFEFEVKKVIDQWKIRDAWMQGIRNENGFEISQCMPQREENNNESQIMQAYKPNLSFILPAYQMETSDANWDSLWQQIMSDNDFILPDMGVE